MIGIFDSGVGGLSVLREIVKILPQESYIYFADNAHCPYGSKSAAYIIDRAKTITEFLIQNGAEIIVVACNTATSAAIATLRADYSDKDNPQVRERVLSLSGGRQDHIKFIGMEPAVKQAALSTKSGVVGVLATAGTLKAGKYISTRDQYSAGVKVVEHVGEGFVEMVENEAVDEAVVEASVRPLIEAGADTIVLGCTHYPFLKDAILSVATSLAPGRSINIIDPAPAVARQLLKVMKAEGLVSQAELPATQNIAVQTAPAVKLCSSGPDTTLKNLYAAIFVTPNCSGGFAIRRQLRESQQTCPVKSDL